MLAKPRCDPAAVLKQGRELSPIRQLYANLYAELYVGARFRDVPDEARVNSSKHYGVNREELGSSRPIIMSKTNPLDTREFRLGSVLWKKG